MKRDVAPEELPSGVHAMTFTLGGGSTTLWFMKRPEERSVAPEKGTYLINRQNLPETQGILLVKPSGWGAVRVLVRTADGKSVPLPANQFLLETNQIIIQLPPTPFESIEIVEQNKSKGEGESAEIIVPLAKPTSTSL